MNRGFNSIYLKLAIAGFLAVLPAGALILYGDFARLNRLLDQQMEEHFAQVSSQVMAQLPTPGELSTRFEQDAPNILTRFNAASAAARIAQGSLYKIGDGDNIYRLIQTVQIDKTGSVPLLSTNVFKPVEFSRLQRIDDLRYKFALPVPRSRNPDYVLLLQAIDEGRPAYIRKAIARSAVFWVLTFLAVFSFMAFVIHSEVKIPLRHLRNAFSQKRKTALDPDDFGDFSELVRTLEDFRMSREETGGEKFLDPDTGFPMEVGAEKIFEDTRRAKEESFIAFFKVNYAKDYIKVFGWANRRIIKKIMADALDACLPKTTPRAVTEDYFFICGLNPKDFKGVVDKCRHKFNEDILKLYEIGQGKQVPIQTISAFAISNHAPGVDSFGQAQALVEKHLESATDVRRGTWAILNSDGVIEGVNGILPIKVQPAVDPAPTGEPTKEKPKARHIETTERGDVVRLAAESAPRISVSGAPSVGVPDSDPAPKVPAARISASGAPSVGVSDADPTPAESSEAPMDPGLARKMFIVKLCRLAAIKPRMAAQVYSAGWQRPDLLLQSKIQDISSRAAIPAEDASQLLANLRKLPKEKLSYTQEDYREVFLTDVRMIRKISRESLSRWFDAGFRRIEDLRNAAADDLIKIDAAVSKEDIEAVLAGSRGG